MALPVSDPAYPYGSKQLTINSVVYIANSISVTLTTTVIPRKNELGVPSGQIIIEDFTTGSAVIQLATTSTAYPSLGDTFSADLIKAGTTQTYIVTSITPNYERESETLLNIEFRKDVAA